MAAQYREAPTVGQSGSWRENTFPVSYAAFRESPHACRRFSFRLARGPDRPSSLPERRASRLLALDGPTGTLAHRQFADLLDYLRPGDLMVFNNTRVIPARLFGQKESGGKLEVLVERVLDQHRVLAHIRASKAPKPGTRILVEGGGSAEMLQRHDALFELAFAEPVLPLLERVGHMPLPPYIDRPDDAADRERYQTVYARRAGAVAAPTAGLHFDEALLEAIRAKGWIPPSLPCMSAPVPSSRCVSSVSRTM